jgi:ribosomal protein L25 (general stress protein Ctc)
LRRAGQLPAVVYNRHLNQPISVDLKAFDRVFRNQGTSSVIDLEVDGEVTPVLVKAVQMDKRRRQPQHVDFYAVTANQPVAVHVPIEFVGVAIGTRRAASSTSSAARSTSASCRGSSPTTSRARRQRAHDRRLAARARPAGVRCRPRPTVLDDLDLAVVAVVPPRVAVEDEEAAEDRRGRARGHRPGRRGRRGLNLEAHRRAR